MFTIRNAKTLPSAWNQDLKKAIQIAFATEKYFAAVDAEKKPALLVRFVRRQGSPDLGVAVLHVDRAGDMRDRLAQMDPSNFEAVEVGDRQVGAMAVVDYWTAPDDLHALVEGTAAGEQGRISVGVMTSGWTFEMHERHGDDKPLCQVASPLSFGALGRGLTDPLAALNERFCAYLS